jgi:5-formyltetrahydrofolate cyclo-ligase
VNDLAERKQLLRQHMRTERAALSEPQRHAETAACNAAIIAYLKKYPTAAVASYLAAGTELALHAVHQHCWQTSQALYLPRVVGPGTLSWHAVQPPLNLIRGAYGISEPDPTQHPSSTLPPQAIVLVPGLAFAAHGHRLGQGQGFYDRALAKHRGTTIGIGFSCQRCDELPHTDHDRRLDGVILGGDVLLISP